MRRRSAPLAWVGQGPILKFLVILHNVFTGFYSLFSVTEEPWVTSGGTPALLS
jgi:hypothetical protein